MKLAEPNLFQGEFKNQPETAKEGGEKNEEGGDTFAKAAFFLRVLKQLLVIVIDGDGILLTFIYMVCIYPVNVYNYNDVNGTTKTGHRQLSMKH